MHHLYRGNPSKLPHFCIVWSLQNVSHVMIFAQCHVMASLGYRNWMVHDMKGSSLNIHKLQNIYKQWKSQTSNSHFAVTSFQQVPTKWLYLKLQKQWPRMVVGKSQYSRKIISHGVYLYTFCELRKMSHSFTRILAFILGICFCHCFPSGLLWMCQGADFQRRRGSPEMDFRTGQNKKHEGLHLVSCKFT